MPKYRPGEKVYVLNASSGGKDGPFTVGIPQNCCYQLRDSQGQLVQGGKLFEEKELEEVMDF